MARGLDPVEVYSYLYEKMKGISEFRYHLRSCIGTWGIFPDQWNYTELKMYSTIERMENWGEIRMKREIQHHRIFNFWPGGGWSLGPKREHNFDTEALKRFCFLLEKFGQDLVNIKSALLKKYVKTGKETHINRMTTHLMSDRLKWSA